MFAFAATASADLDFTSISAEIDARAATATGRLRTTCLGLQKTLARADRVGLADDFRKLRAVEVALSRRLSGDTALAAAAEATIADGLDELVRESTDLTVLSLSLTSPRDRARCQTVGKRGDRFAAAASKARAVGRGPATATYARRAAARYAYGVVLATKLLARQNLRGATWSVPLSARGGSLLSVWTGPGPNPDVYVVGAQDADGPIFLRMAAEGWVRVPVAATGDLWWVSGVGDQIYASGTGGRVVRYDPATGALSDMSTGVDVTLYGVWGLSTDDVWAVGGNVDGNLPRTALMHHHGGSWTSVPLPDEANNRTLFKVWGPSADDVWACGQAGLVMHYDGIEWSVRPGATFESLFTVHGDSPTIIVGGAVEPSLVEGGAAGFAPATLPSGVNNLRGVFQTATGDAWAAGLGGTVLRRVNGRWTRVGGLPPTSGNDFHSVAVDDAGGVYLAGGDLSSLDQGALVYYGARVLPPANAVYAQAKLSEKIAPIFSADRDALRPWSCSVGGCHVAASPSANLDLFVDSHSMWTRLVSVPSSESTLYRVLPGRPSLSYLFQKLAGAQAGVGAGNERMPIGGPYLDPSDMDAVRAWILEGARDN